MSERQLSDAIERTERALDRIERLASSLAESGTRERQLKATVRDVVAELDSLIAGGAR